MAFFNKTNLSFGDEDPERDEFSSLMKHTHPTRISKQHLAEHKMFGKKRSGIQIGKKFTNKKKGIMKSIVPPHMVGSSKGISPSLGEFDKMMDSVVKSRRGGSFFGHKKFG